MGKDDLPHFEMKAELPAELERSKDQKLVKKLPISQKKLNTSNDDPAWRKKYNKRTSMENLQVEDEAILDFLTNNRKRRGVIGRNRSIKAAEEPLNQLENQLNSMVNRPNEKKWGRPRKDNIKFSLFLTPLMLKYIDDYAQKNGVNSMQEAVRDMIKDFLRVNDYPVGKTLGK
jgi:hypothetical protein